METVAKSVAAGEEAVAEVTLPECEARQAVHILGPNVIRLVNPPADKLHEDSLIFKHGGRRYKLYKRNKSRDGNYFIKFEYGRKQWVKGLETNVLTVARVRAKSYIDKVRGQKWGEVEKLSARQPTSTIGDIEPLYRKFALISSASIENNLWAMGKVLKTVLGVSNWREVSLAEINASLVAGFQAEMVNRYVAEAMHEAEQIRAQRELALRSSKSIVNQARSLFNKDKSLIAQYSQTGLRIPEGVQGFMTCKVQGRICKGEYLAPSDEVVQKAFCEIEKLRETDRNAYLAFWFAAGAGLRRSEIQRCRWEFWVERDGMVWISGGLGKDGRRIEVPMQQRAIDALKPLRLCGGRIMGVEMGKEFAKRLNFWMKQQGWNTEKKMHELRAYVGSLIYRVNPLAAMKFMRHKSIRVTEQYYVRYGATARVPNVL